MNISALLNYDLASAGQSRPDTADKSKNRTVKPRRGSSVSNDGFMPEPMLAQPSLPKTKPKAAKDISQEERADTVGEVIYPPFQIQNGTMKQELEEFDIDPLVDIADFPQRIPYTSDKNRFQSQTGRNGFEAFQYRFAHPSSKNADHEKYVVKWDYNIGLVRITPFFKALGEQKTVPAKAISMTDGLKDICHSITGGSIPAQGYWMPFEAAKALAATFCWNIRFALVPLFGPGFVDICTRPEDPAYKRYTIDTSVVKYCQEQVRSWTQSTSQTTINAMRGEGEVKASPVRIAKTKPKILRARAQQPRYTESESSDDLTSRAIGPRDPTPYPSTWKAANAGSSRGKSQTNSTVSPAPSSVLCPTWHHAETSSKRPMSEDGDSDFACSWASPDVDDAGHRRKVLRLGVFDEDETNAARALLSLRGN